MYKWSILDYDNVGLFCELFGRLKKTGKPVIVVLTHGAPVPSSVYSEVDAVLSAGYTGQGKSTKGIVKFDFYSSQNYYNQYRSW